MLKIGMSVNNIKKKRKKKGIDVEKGENERLKNKKNTSMWIDYFNFNCFSNSF